MLMTVISLQTNPFCYNYASINLLNKFIQGIYMNMKKLILAALFMSSIASLPSMQAGAPADETSGAAVPAPAAGHRAGR